MSRPPTGRRAAAPPVAAAAAASSRASPPPTPAAASSSPDTSLDAQLAQEMTQQERRAQLQAAPAATASSSSAEPPPSITLAKSRVVTIYSQSLLEEDRIWDACLLPNSTFIIYVVYGDHGIYKMNLLKPTPHSEKNLIAGSSAETSDELALDQPADGPALEARFHSPECLLWDDQRNCVLVGERNVLRTLHGKAIGGKGPSRVETLSGGWSPISENSRAEYHNDSQVDPRARNHAVASGDLSEAKWNHVVRLCRDPADPTAILVHDACPGDLDCFHAISRIASADANGRRQVTELFRHNALGNSSMLQIVPLKNDCFIIREGKSDSTWKSHLYSPSRSQLLTLSSPGGRDCTPYALPDNSLILSESELFQQATFELHEDGSGHIIVCGGPIGVRDESRIVDGETSMVRFNDIQWFIFLEHGMLLVNDCGFVRLIYEEDSPLAAKFDSHKQSAQLKKLIVQANERHVKKKPRGVQPPAAAAAAVHVPSAGRRRLKRPPTPDDEESRIIDEPMEPKNEPTASSDDDGERADRKRRRRKQFNAGQSNALMKSKKYLQFLRHFAEDPSSHSVVSVGAHLSVESESDSSMIDEMPPLDGAQSYAASAAAAAVSSAAIIIGRQSAVDEQKELAAAALDPSELPLGGYVFIASDTHLDFERLNRHRVAAGLLPLNLQVPSSYHRYQVGFTRNPKLRYSDYRAVGRVCFLRLKRVKDCRAADEAIRFALSEFGIRCKVRGRRRWFRLKDALTKETLLRIFYGITMKAEYHDPIDDEELHEMTYFSDSDSDVDLDVGPGEPDDDAKDDADVDFNLTNPATLPAIAVEEEDDDGVRGIDIVDPNDERPTKRPKLEHESASTSSAAVVASSSTSAPAAATSSVAQRVKLENGE